ncbi:MAG: hypothetical protein ACXAEU_06630 [Candidatus Hodarchaeales archaeon]
MLFTPVTNDLLVSMIDPVDEEEVGLEIEIIRIRQVPSNIFNLIFKIIHLRNNVR